MLRKNFALAVSEPQPSGQPALLATTGDLKKLLFNDNY
jgi:hypothetical protein